MLVKAWEALPGAADLDGEDIDLALISIVIVIEIIQLTTIKYPPR